jgi:hypothetical protein
MGRYINQLPDGTALLPNTKLDKLIEAGAKVVPAPTKPEDWQENLVCVVQNAMFDAAGYAYDAREMMAFASDRSGRPMTWLIVPDADLIAYPR